MQEPPKAMRRSTGNGDATDNDSTEASMHTDKEGNEFTSHNLTANDQYQADRLQELASNTGEFRAAIVFYDQENRAVATEALLDSGSPRNFISGEKARAMRFDFLDYQGEHMVFFGGRTISPKHIVKARWGLLQVPREGNAIEESYRARSDAMSDSGTKGDKSRRAELGTEVNDKIGKGEMSSFAEISKAEDEVDAIERTTYPGLSTGRLDSFVVLEDMGSWDVLIGWDILSKLNVPASGDGNFPIQLRGGASSNSSAQVPMRVEAAHNAMGSSGAFQGRGGYNGRGGYKDSTESFPDIFTEPAEDKTRSYHSSPSLLTFQAPIPTDGEPGFVGPGGYNGRGGYNGHGGYNEAPRSQSRSATPQLLHRTSSPSQSYTSRGGFNGRGGSNEVAEPYNSSHLGVPPIYIHRSLCDDNGSGDEDDGCRMTYTNRIQELKMLNPAQSEVEEHDKIAWQLEKDGLLQDSNADLPDPTKDDTLSQSLSGSTLVSTWKGEDRPYDAASVTDTGPYEAAREEFISLIRKEKRLEDASLGVEEFLRPETFEESFRNMFMDFAARLREEASHPEEKDAARAASINRIYIANCVTEGIFKMTELEPTPGKRDVLEAFLHKYKERSGGYNGVEVFKGEEVDDLDAYGGNELEGPINLLKMEKFIQSSRAWSRMFDNLEGWMQAVKKAKQLDGKTGDVGFNTEVPSLRDTRVQENRTDGTLPFESEVSADVKNAVSRLQVALFWAWAVVSCTALVYFLKLC
ncbi:hypothetical protein DIS24_g7014 [Lasiodiplodia hormozganensis]|uniref:Uncharacterized protein n=1 Tax=Lasiodiplodia hormozganensis TaxID=869390 RepID=A0AA40CV46_9PEZI|nr:hypothetical protein DIS24_g7014 [Lasiodiplodia hormozganensis]